MAIYVYNISKFFKAFVIIYTEYYITVNEDIILHEEFKDFQSKAIWFKKALATFLEAFMVLYKAENLDNVTYNIVFENFNGLLLYYS